MQELRLIQPASISTKKLNVTLIHNNYEQSNAEHVANIIDSLQRTQQH